ncbi:MAG TPA: MerR family transcriptional regulator [Cyanobacteria bacterium UBA8553]|nr:MerR family transcriptional regulator [Cyanobacteria bacterium UBA8553]HAJ58285.1 MerR family transcriptional regulator [Cyanobacteria bacterium UBA8543]
MQPTAMKVGELAKQTGISVRTLHYYDEIKLLSPSQRTRTDHRLYTAEDIARLQQIVSLRQLGFSLDEIRECLERPAYSLHRVIELHMARLKEQLALSMRLLNRLEAIARNLHSTESVSIEDLIQTIEAITMFEKYYTPEQAETLQKRAELLGEEGMRQGQAQWQELIEQVRAQKEKGTDPTSESVQALARRWQELIEQFTGGDPGIEQSLNRMYQQEGPEVASRGAVDSDLFEYMGKAIAQLKGSYKDEG